MVQEIVTQAAIQYLLPILLDALTLVITASATAIVGRLTYWLFQWTGWKADSAHAEKLAGSLRNGLAAGAGAFAGIVMDRVAKRQAIVNFAADYTQQLNPDAVKHFGLTQEAVRKRAEAELSKLPGFTP